MACSGSNTPALQLESYDPGKGKRNRYGDYRGICSVCSAHVRTYANSAAAPNVAVH